ncbi:hypothetical protein DFR70_12660 [Nocardia tenerifensis]|uniref:Uncharacterized protein n=1 Tax=Nocardia tenerifensis TaxID=228006 RepID=A0A318JL44_9NOCA|nr:hypothetical protein [Nocardia tenerifensis]PXX53939.1 hypothetical protein DFR70_12660 [Nocardia tenerifensis]
MTVPIGERDEYPEPRIIVHETPVVGAGTLPTGTLVHYLDFRTTPVILNDPVYTVREHTGNTATEELLEPSNSAGGYLLQDPVGRERHSDLLSRPGWYVASELPIDDDIDFYRLGQQGALAGLPPIAELDANYVRARALLPHRGDDFARSWAQGWHSRGRPDTPELAEWESALHKRYDFSTLDRFLTRLVVELRTDIERGLARTERLPVHGAVAEFLTGTAPLPRNRTLGELSDLAHEDRHTGEARARRGQVPPGGLDRDAVRTAAAGPLTAPPGARTTSPTTQPALPASATQAPTAPRAGRSN